MFKNTFKDAVLSQEDITVETKDIEALPYASMYAQLETGNRSFVVLGFADPNVQSQPLQDLYSLSWLSADKKTLVTESGRLIRTDGLIEGNLLASFASEPDPIALGLLKDSTPLTWQRHIDWQPGNHFGVKLVSTFTRQGVTSIDVNGREVSAVHFTEYVNAPSYDVSYQNDFWLNPSTGNVLKSKQRVAPLLPSLSLVVLKPFSPSS
ncbi:YjbF family lipoprotein [Veronia nyctiphanis]|uniref:YjbF family lipoprotein n=1 Tax=Veronia nyctiphanis TaxID=1278244 RepID=UPI0013760741|nr:YjbF family lipoprotein [Veronia nyctiphanis]